MSRLEESLNAQLKDSRHYLSNSSGYTALYGHNLLGYPTAFAVGEGEEKKTDTVFMGMEWEILASSQQTNEIVVGGLEDEVLRHYINFASGGDPMEMITIPCTLKVHQEKMKKFFDLGLQKHFGTFHHHSGTHIHISKAAFTKVTLAKFITFIVNESNNSFIEDIAGRPMGKNTQWRRPNHVIFKHFKSGKKKDRIRGVEINLTNDLRQIQIPKKDSEYFPDGKGVAVNTGTGRPTIELRIFKSQKSYQKVMKNLEFVDALVNYCRVSTYNKLYVPEFISYVIRNAAKYPNLVSDTAIRKRLRLERGLKEA